MSEDFFKKGKRMTNEEDKAYFRKKATLRKGTFEWETARLQKALHDHIKEWSEREFPRFVNSESGQAFLEKHKDKSWEKIFEIFERETNFNKLVNQEFKKKYDELRGKVS